MTKAQELDEIKHRLCTEYKIPIIYAIPDEINSDIIFNNSIYNKDKVVFFSEIEGDLKELLIDNINERE